MKSRVSPASFEIIQQLILRPLEQKIREHKYRCAQSIVFGLPVIALQYFGKQLGGAESVRWVAVLQMILSGWIVYIGATGLVSEGVIVLLTTRHVTADFLVGLTAVIAEVTSIVATILILAGRVTPIAPMFHLAVILLILWGGLRWMLLSLRLKLVTPGNQPGDSPVDQ